METSNESSDVVRDAAALAAFCFVCGAQLNEGSWFIGCQPLPPTPTPRIPYLPPNTWLARAADNNGIFAHSLKAPRLTQTLLRLPKNAQNRNELEFAPECESNE